MPRTTIPPHKGTGASVPGGGDPQCLNGSEHAEAFHVDGHKGARLPAQPLGFIRLGVNVEIPITAFPRRIPDIRGYRSPLDFRTATRNAPCACLKEARRTGTVEHFAPHVQSDLDAFPTLRPHWTVAEIDGVGLTSPSSNRQRDRPRAFGCELKATRRRHRQPGDPAHDRAEPAVTQALLGACRDGLVVLSFDVDHPVRAQAYLRERGCEQIRTRQAPQHLPHRPRRDAGDEQRGSDAVDRAAAAPGYFVKRAEFETLRRQAIVDFAQAEGELSPVPARSALGSVDLLRKALHGWFLMRVNPRSLLFVICSFNEAEGQPAASPPPREDGSCAVTSMVKSIRRTGAPHGFRVADAQSSKNALRCGLC